jgi:hypothetical protein
MPFGKYEGRTVPQVLFKDPDYFFGFSGKGFSRAHWRCEANRWQKKLAESGSRESPPKRS